MAQYTFSLILIFTVLNIALAFPEEVKIVRNEEAKSIPLTFMTKAGKYTLHTQKRNWPAAKAYCENDLKKLVILETSEEFRTVLANLVVNGVLEAWSDGFGDVSGQHYIWSSSGRKVDNKELEEVCSDDDVFGNGLIIKRAGLIGRTLEAELPFVCEI